MSEVLTSKAESRSQRAVERGAKWLRSKHAPTTLAGIAFIESVFAPIIIDPFLVALILATPKRWKYFTIVSIIASIIGGMFAYILGLLFFDTLGVMFIELYSLQDWFGSLSQSLNSNGFVFVLLGAFTPIPYKIIALTSGFLQINVYTFIVASIFGRALRLGLVGFAASTVGPRALPTVQRNLHLFAAIIGLIFFIYILIRIVY